MNERFDSSGVRYAVIAGLRTKAGPERFVIAYPNEKSLRDLIAERSIIAIGFSSREQAAVARNFSLRPAAASYEQLRKKIAVWSERCLLAFTWADRRAVVRRAARFLVSAYSGASTTALVIFFSTNAVSSLIRMALGSSV